MLGYKKLILAGLQELLQLDFQLGLEDLLEREILRALGAMIFGIFMLPLDLWIKGYFSMGLFFLVSSTISVSKTLRDKHEYDRIINRVEEAKTEKILKEYGT